MVHGHCDPRFESVRKIFEDAFESGPEIGAAACFTLDGEAVVDLWGGHMDREKTRPWERDTLVNVYSTTKGMTALCAHLRESAAALGMEAALLADYGGGVVQAVLPWPEAHAAAGLAGWIGTLREAVRPQRGYVTLQAAPAELKQAAGVWSGLEGEGDIMALLKARFDPNNILAPGRFLRES